MSKSPHLRDGKHQRTHQQTRNTAKRLQPLSSDGGAAMFDRIAAAYDTLNGVMGLGFERLWRRALVRSLCLRSGARVLDVATGTADVALAIAKHADNVQVVGIDPSAQMLALGQRKVRAAALNKRVLLLDGNAMRLDFESHSFDAATCAFGLRNFPNRLKGLQEMVRVCRGGAVICVLELGNPTGVWYAPLLRFYIRWVLPLLGRWLAKDQAAYAYLASSMRNFLVPQAVCTLLEQAGCHQVRARAYLGGVACLYTARVQKHAANKK